MIWTFSAEYLHIGPKLTEKVMLWPKSMTNRTLIDLHNVARLVI